MGAKLGCRIGPTESLEGSEQSLRFGFEVLLDFHGPTRVS
jgi:hypothetical protein